MFKWYVAILALMTAVAACGATSTETPTSTTAAPTSSVTTSTAAPPSMATTSTRPTTSPSSSASTATTVRAPVYTLESAGIDIPTVEVLDIGAEPRRMLAFSPMIGDVSYSEVVLEFSTAQELNGAAPVGSDLSVRVATRNTVLETNDEGFVTEITSLSAEVLSSNADVVAALEPLYAFLPGISTYSQVAPSGAHVAEDNSQMAGFIDASGQDLGFTPGDLVSPFPDEPVGVGARWLVTVTIVEEFVAIEQRTIYELVAHDDDVVTLTVEVEQTLLNLESLGVGLDNPQVAYVAAGSGNIVIDLAVISPLESSLTLTQRIVIEGEADGESISVITTNVVTTTATTDVDV